MAKKRPAQRCEKEKRDGSRCGAYAVMGGTVCRNHLRPSPAADVIVREKLAEYKAEKVAGRSVWQPSAEDHQALRIRTIMLSIAKMQTLVKTYYEAARQGDQHAAVMVAGYQRELTSLLKIAPAPDAGEVKFGAVDAAVADIAAMIDGTMAAAPLRRV